MCENVLVGLEGSVRERVGRFGGSIISLRSLTVSIILRMGVWFYVVLSLWFHFIIHTKTSGRGVVTDKWEGCGHPFLCDSVAGVEVMREGVRREGVD